MKLLTRRFQFILNCSKRSYTIYYCAQAHAPFCFVIQFSLPETEKIFVFYVRTNVCTEPLQSYRQCWHITFLPQAVHQSNKVALKCLSHMHDNIAILKFKSASQDHCHQKRLLNCRLLPSVLFVLRTKLGSCEYHFLRSLWYNLVEVKLVT